MSLLERIREIVDQVAASEGIELVDVELHGHGPSAILRIFLDKPAGITHKDCQVVSHQVGALLDVEDMIEDRYTLEVSSPGLDRKLVKPADYQRFAGSRINLALKVAREGRRRFRGLLLGMEQETVRVDIGDGQVMSFAYGEIEKANLVAEFSGRPGASSGKEMDSR
ncbi:MAG: ribosome maturation factor RimP [Acidobacteria bacterium]|nr:ribosome maturation factor RimP [Acidobacteriota bacterium]